MQLGKSLVGAVIGGLVGAAVCVAITKFTGWDKMWLAILVALLTGIGVRMLVDTRGHASYARGALTAILAIAAYFLSFWASTLITTKGAAAREINAQAGVRQAAADDAADDNAADDAADNDAADGEAADTDDAADTDAADGIAADAADDEAENADDRAANDNAAVAQAATQQRTDRAAGLARNQRQQAWSPWDIAALILAALVAYQLGRGSEGPRAYATDGSVRDDEPAPVRPGQYPPSD
jgi:hypothetical protein